jgi:hypothetical protein
MHKIKMAARGVLQRSPLVTMEQHADAIHHLKLDQPPKMKVKDNGKLERTVAFIEGLVFVTDLWLYKPTVKGLTNMNIFVFIFVFVS